jgi:hypothetical protein
MEPKADWKKCKCGCWNGGRQGYYTARIGLFTVIACTTKWGVRDQDVHGAAANSNDTVDQMLGAEQWVRDTAIALLKELA